jgi:hypothetical protein
VVPDAPDFTNCIASLQKAAGKGKTAPTAAQAKSQCQSQFDQQKGQVLNLLITSAWIQGQAKAMGISASDKEVQTQFEKTKTQAFGTGAKGAAAYQKFLKQSGETKDDILFRVKIDALSTKIRDKAIKGLSGKKQQAELQKFIKSFQADWKARTECAMVYIIDLCKNAPKQAAAQQPGSGTVKQAPPTPGG